MLPPVFFTLKRFMNADILEGSIADSTSLNVFTYVNGNPISYVDPWGLSADRGGEGAGSNSSSNPVEPSFEFDYSKFTDPYFVADTTVQTLVNEDTLNAFYNSIRNSILTETRPNNIGPGTWAKYVDSELKYVDDMFGKTSAVAKGVKTLPYISVVIDTGIGIAENIHSGTSPDRIASDAVVDIGFGLGGIGASALGGLAAGGLAGSAVPVVGNIAGAVGGAVGGIAFYIASEVIQINGKSPIEWTKEGAGWLVDKISSWWD